MFFETEFLLVSIKQILIEGEGGRGLDLTDRIGNLFYSVYSAVWMIGLEAGFNCHNRIVARYLANFSVFPIYNSETIRFNIELK